MAETPRRSPTLGAPVGARASHGPGLGVGDPASGPRGAPDGARPPRGAGARAQAPRTAPAAASLPRPSPAQPRPRAPGDRHIGLSVRAAPASTRAAQRPAASRDPPPRSHPPPGSARRGRGAGRPPEVTSRGTAPGARTPLGPRLPGGGAVRFRGKRRALSAAASFLQVQVGHAEAATPRVPDRWSARATVPGRDAGRAPRCILGRVGALRPAGSRGVTRRSAASAAPRGVAIDSRTGKRSSALQPLRPAKFTSPRPGAESLACLLSGLRFNVGSSFIPSDTAVGRVRLALLKACKVFGKVVPW